MAEQLEELTVRAADVDDAAAIARVHVESWREAYAGIVPPEHLSTLDVDERTARWTDLLTRGPHDDVRTWVALTDKLVGFATLGPARDEDAGRMDLEIYSIYLEPRMWGKGVARDVMRTVLAEVPPRTPVTLWVLAANERAQHFYRRNGFTADGTERFEEFGDAALLQVRYRRG